MESLKTLKTEKFLNALMENENWNIILEVTGPNEENIILNYTKNIEELSWMSHNVSFCSFL